jgi:hypothetical protein
MAGFIILRRIAGVKPSSKSITREAFQDVIIFWTPNEMKGKERKYFQLYPVHPVKRIEFLKEKTTIILEHTP